MKKLVGGIGSVMREIGRDGNYFFNVSIVY